MKQKVRGKAEEIKGRVTGSRTEVAKGKARQAVGEAQRVGRDIRDEVKHEVKKAGRAIDRSRSGRTVEVKTTTTRSR